MPCPKQMAPVHQFCAGRWSLWLFWPQQSCHAAAFSHLRLHCLTHRFTDTLPCVPPSHPPCPAQRSSTPQGESWGAALHSSLVLPCLCGVHPLAGPATSLGGTALHPPPGPAALACLHASLSTNPAMWCPGTCCLGRSWHILTPEGAIPRRERGRRRHREPCCSRSPRKSEELLPCLRAGHRQGLLLWGALGSGSESPETQPA